jgi:hypothetical protein
MALAASAQLVVPRSDTDFPIYWIARAISVIAQSIGSQSSVPNGYANIDSDRSCLRRFLGGRGREMQIVNSTVLWIDG